MTSNAIFTVSILVDLQVQKTEQEVGDGLSVCVMNILPKVNSLPSLLAINLMKMEI